MNDDTSITSGACVWTVKKPIHCDGLITGKLNNSLQWFHCKTVVIKMLGDVFDEIRTDFANQIGITYN